MKTADFDYELPPELIAQEPAPSRDDARMLVLHRKARTWEHCGVKDLPEFLQRGDLLVVNDTRVIPARVFGRKEPTGGKVEILFLEEIEPGLWDALLRCARRPRVGSWISLPSGRARAQLIEDGELGRVKLRIESDRPFLDILEENGVAPLPPYISRDYSDADRLAADRERYQTVYARTPGAVAAPTAGLHFSEPLFARLEEKGIARTSITLHVGIGTFRPVSAEQVADHKMDEERYEVPSQATETIERARAGGHRIVAVGTTSVRTLETVAAQHREVRPCSGRTSLFIYPPYEFRMVDAMVTNFHLPRSTLLMMICAFADRDLVFSAYREAAKERYRFYSYGDCMLIL